MTRCVAFGETCRQGFRTCNTWRSPSRLADIKSSGGDSPTDRPTKESRSEYTLPIFARPFDQSRLLHGKGKGKEDRGGESPVQSSDERVDTHQKDTDLEETDEMDTP